MPVALVLTLLVAVLACTDAPAGDLQLPATVGGFSQDGFQRYDDPQLGYSYSYQDKDARRRMDVYVYPVPAVLLERAHAERVQILTAVARRDISSAVANGVYLSQTELGVDGYEIDGLVVFKARHGIRTAQGELYAVVYLTETGGQAVKVRVSVPSTALNAVNEDFEEPAVALLFDVVEALGGR